MICDLSDFVASRKKMLATQYRESENLNALLDMLLEPVEDLAKALCDVGVPDIDTAVGDQLTILGKVLGWGRVNANGPTKPVFGFACQCNPTGLSIAGFCEGNWYVTGDASSTLQRDVYEFTDDEEYRRFLKAIIYRHRSDYRRGALQEASEILFGPDAIVHMTDVGSGTVYTGRALTPVERTIGHLFTQVMPIAPAMYLRLYETPSVPFGFGDGWGGLCSGHLPSLVAAERRI